MYELNSQIFWQLLEETTEDTAEDDFTGVEPYLLENVGFPLLRGQPLIPNQVDYSRFALDDLYDLLDAAQEHYRRHFRLQRMNEHLCGQAASQSLRRAFC